MMGLDLCMSKPKWYAVYVATGQEDNVKSRLEYKFEDSISFYVPKRKMRERKGGIWHDVSHIMFPGYVLAKGHIGTDEYYGFKNIPGLWRLLLSGGELLPIPEGEIEIFRRLMQEGEVIGPSDLQEEGGHVHVVQGPLEGMEGYIVKIDRRKGRAKVKMNFLGEERIVDLSVNLLENI